MSDLPTDPSPIRRILVGVDASPHSLAALRVAIDFASRFGAEVKGLFVEDQALLRATSLSVAREVQTSTVASRPAQMESMRQQLRQQSEHARRRLQQLAREAGVSHGFESVEGRITKTILEASEDTDLVVLGKTSRHSSRQKLGSTARRVFTEAAASVLVLRDEPPTGRGVITYYDGSESADRALRMAAQLARRHQSSLTVLLPENAESDHRERIQATYEVYVPVLRIRSLAPLEVSRLAPTICREGGGLLVMPDTTLPHDARDVEQFMYETNTPVFVVR